MAMMGAAMALVLPADALARPKVFVLKMNSPAFDGSETFKSNPSHMTNHQRLIEIEASMSSAAQLDGDIPQAVRNKIDKKNKVSSTGSVWLSSAASTSLYCAPVKTVSWPLQSRACLRDSDGDGRFDAAYNAIPSDWQPGGLIVSGEDPDHALVGVELGEPIALPEPVPYHLAGREMIPRHKAQIRWSSDFNAEISQPVHVHFWLGGHNDDSGGSMMGPIKSVTFDGTPVDVELGGLAITVVKFGRNGELYYRLSGQITDVDVPFSYRDFKLVIRYY